MPSVRYFNQTAPFWDFVANLESAGAEHPFFAAYNPESREAGNGAAQAAQEQDAPASAPNQDGPAQDQPNPEHHEHHHPHQHPFGPGFPFGGRRGGPHHRGGSHGFRRGGGRCSGGGPSSCGGPSGFGGWNMGSGGLPFDMSKIGEFFATQFGADADKPHNDNNANSKDFTPPADVFDTEDAYMVHISLPGAKKEDVGVNWDADKSELSVAGVIYRPGDEDFLKTLALDERKVGVFERKVRLGSRALPAQVDAEAIGAKMEDGVLIVTIPKLDREYVEIKKVDIE